MTTSLASAYDRCLHLATLLLADDEGNNECIEVGNEFLLKLWLKLHSHLARVDDVERVVRLGDRAIGDYFDEL